MRPRLKISWRSARWTTPTALASCGQSLLRHLRLRQPHRLWHLRRSNKVISGQRSVELTQKTQLTVGRQLLITMLFRLFDVTKSYGAQEVLRGVTFQLNPGEHAGLVGRNGAGKT